MQNCGNERAASQLLRPRIRGSQLRRWISPKQTSYAGALIYSPSIPWVWHCPRTCWYQEDKDIISVLGAVTCYQGLVLHIQLTVIMYQALQQNPVETVLESEEEQIVQWVVHQDECWYMGRSLPEIALASNWAVRLDSLDLKPGSTFVSFTYLLIDWLKKKKKGTNVSSYLVWVIVGLR